jgi:hypothetical protein
MKRRSALCSASMPLFSLVAVAGFAVPLATISGPARAEASNNAVVPAGPVAAVHPHRLYLRTGEVDTSQAPAGGLAAQIGAHPAGTRFVIQLEGPITPQRRAELVNAGIDLGPYLPMFAYIVTLDRAERAAVERLDFVRWHSIFRDEWKLDPEIGVRPYSTPERREMVAGGRDYMVVAVFPRADVNAVERAILGLPAAGVRGAAANPPQIVDRVQSGSPEIGGIGTDLYLDIALDQVPMLALIPGVQFVEPAPDITVRAMAARNDKSRWVVQTNQEGVMPLYGKGIRGEGQIGAILDTAVRQDHCSFHDPSNPIGPNHRKIVAYNTAPGSASHGTHVAGSMIGDAGQETGNTRGVAYMGRLAYNSWGSAPYSDIAQRLTTHHNQGARVHSNSWGDDGTTAYNVLARGIDVFQWDNENSLTLWAVTNTSALKNPENAKNTLAIGATRVAPNQDQHGYGGSGPTSDGRRKPEVYAPGRDTISASSSTTCGTTSSGGTSMACPVAAGVAMLTRQYFMDGFYPVGIPLPGSGFEPSSALVKAVLVNSAVDMTGVAGYPTNQEGWGRILINNTLYFDGDPRKLRLYDVRNGDGLSTSQFTEYLLPVLGSGERLKITLAWTEPPGTLNASFASVNDLDLEVVDPNGQLYRGNVFNTTAGHSITGGAKDDRNNVEQVHINNPVTGAWTVRVRGAAVNQALQGYALVMTGDITPAQPPALILLLAEPVPFLVGPGQSHEMRIRILEGSNTLIPGSAKLHYRAGGSGPFAEVPMVQVGGSGEIYAANLPAHACGNTPQFYFSALADDNSLVVLPEGAPEFHLSTQIGTMTEVPVMEQSFASAWPTGWSATGLWQVISSCAPGGNVCSPGPYAYYGRTATCNYNLPTGQNSGILSAPQVSVPNIPPQGFVKLTFCYALETENHPNLDKAEVFINGQTRPEWRIADVRPTAAEPDRYWRQAEIDLSEFAGQNVSLSFRFNTITSANNAFRGWHVNNVRLLASAVGCTDPGCYANCDDSTTPPILNVEDFSCFINKFAEAQALPPEQQLTHYANCDQSTTAPVLNVEDFSCFINKFAQGCP